MFNWAKVLKKTMKKPNVTSSSRTFHLLTSLFYQSNSLINKNSDCFSKPDACFSLFSWNLCVLLFVFGVEAATAAAVPASDTWHQSSQTPGQVAAHTHTSLFRPSRFLLSGFIFLLAVLFLMSSDGNIFKSSCSLNVAQQKRLSVGLRTLTDTNDVNRAVSAHGSTHLETLTALDVKAFLHLIIARLCWRRPTFAGYIRPQQGQILDQFGPPMKSMK